MVCTLRDEARKQFIVIPHGRLHLQLSLKRGGRWGTRDDDTISLLHFSLSSTALWDLANSRPVRSLVLSSHLFLCPPYLHPPFAAPCEMVSARPDEREICPCQCNFRLFTMVRKSLRWPGGLRLVRLPVGSWHRLPRW